MKFALRTRTLANRLTKVHNIEISKADQTTTISEIKNKAIEALIKKYSTQTNSQNSQTSQAEPPKKKPLSIVERILVSTNDANTPELKRFLKEPPLLYIKNFNPLVWWNSRSDDFPVLRKIAMDYMLIQPTSVPSERIFSQGELVVSSLRPNLSIKSVKTFVLKNMD